MTNRIVKRGEGWQIGFDGDAIAFRGLLGNDDWAFELTEPEFIDFCRFTQQLAETMQAIASELMSEERIACEVESEWLWLEAEGFPDAYSLHLILSQGRRCEAFWSPIAARELTTAARTIQVF